ncbi:hypothetical protein KSF78_0004911 [Schistosoma japonicum]|nr:hypothetical protein KSF78_0004911 [Schistosoma japonicum]
MHIKFLFPFLLLIVNLFYYLETNEIIIKLLNLQNSLFIYCLNVVNFVESSILSDEDKKQLEKLKGTSEFQLAKEKVLSVLSDKIDNYVLEQLRQTN